MNKCFLPVAFLSATLLLSACDESDSTTGNISNNEIGSEGSTPSQEVASETGISKVYMRYEPYWGPGGLLMMDYQPYVLFEDGSVLDDIVEPLTVESISELKRSSPDRWGTWEISSGMLSVDFGAGNTETIDIEKNLLDAVPAPTGLRLNGEWFSVSGAGTSFQNSVYMQDTFVFLSNGQFTQESFASGNSYNGSIDVTTIVADPSKRGTYVFDGFTLQLTFDDGNRVDMGVYIWSDEDGSFDEDPALGIAGATFYMDD